MRDWRRTVRARLAGRGVDPDRHPSLVDELAQTATPGGPAARPFAGFWQDVKYAVRALRRSPSFTAAAVVTIALCTGPTIAAIGVANWLFLRPPPGIHDPDRLGVVWFGRWQNEGRSFSPSELSPQHLAILQGSLPAIGAIAGEIGSSVNLSRVGAPPRTVGAQLVSHNWFDVLGARLAAGRDFLPDDEREPGGAPVVVLADDIARGFFATAAAAVGQTVRINANEMTVIGVAAPEFEGTVVGQPVSLWLPGAAWPRLAHAPRERWTNDGMFYEFVVRLRDDATFERADAELRWAARALAERGDAEAKKYTEVEPRLFNRLGLPPLARGMMIPFTQRLFGVAVVLVLLGVANLVNLFAFRASRRAQDAALRQSLGASPARLAQLHVIEGVIVSLAGVVVGVAAAWGVSAALDGAPISGVGPLDIAIDWRALAAASVLAVIVGVLLSIVPARVVVRRSMLSVLGGSRTATHTRGRLRSALATVQVALSLMLLIGGLLFLQTLRQLHAVELGVELSGVSRFTFEVFGQGYPIERTRQFYRDLVAHLDEHSGIDAVAAASDAPLGSSSRARVLPPDAVAMRLPDRELEARALRVLTNHVTPEYFRTFGMRFLAGRTFTDTEAYVAGAAPAVVISAALAERLFGTAQAVGRALSFPAQGALPRFDAPIVGVVNDVRWRGPRQAAEDFVYLPFGDISAQNWLLVRSGRPPAEIARIVQEAAARLDANVPVGLDQTMAEAFTRRVANELIFAWVLGALAAIGFALASVGIYGLVSQSVVERLREFGIRMAIGAGRGEIARLVLRQAFVIAAVGVLLGLVLAALGSRLVASQLFGVAPLSPGVYAAAAVALVAAVSAAVLPPARRAMRVNPMDVMRVD